MAVPCRSTFGQAPLVLLPLVATARLYLVKKFKSNSLPALHFAAGAGAGAAVRAGWPAWRSKPVRSPSGRRQHCTQLSVPGPAASNTSAAPAGLAAICHRLATMGATDEAALDGELWRIVIGFV